MDNSSDSSWPMVSVIIPVRNEEKYIARTIRYILDQDYPKERLEVLVVDGRSEDSTRDKVEEIVTRDSRVRLLDNPAKLSSSARNIGAKSASGEIITFIDGHVYIASNQLLKSTATLMETKEVPVLSRPQFLDTPENDYFQRAVAAARESSMGHGLDSTIFLKEDRYVAPDSSGASYKKEIFRDVGYFDEDFDAAEDVEFNHRVGKAGYKSFTSIKLAVYYFPRRDIPGLFQQMVRYGTGRFRLFRKHRISVASGALGLASFFAGLILFWIAGLIFPAVLPLPVLLTLLYFAVLILGSAWTASRNDLRQFPVLPAIFATIHFGLAYGFVREGMKTIIRGGRRGESIQS